MKSILFFLVTLLSNISFAQLKISSGTQFTLVDGGVLTVNEPLVNNGTMSLNSGRLLVSSNFTNQGTLQATNSTIEIIGGNIQSFTFQNNDIVKRLELNKTNNTATVSGGVLTITDRFKSISGTLDAAEKMILKSTSTKTAIVEQSSGGTVNNIVVERYIPAKRAYRILSSPVTSTTSILYNWQENQNNTSSLYANNSNIVAGFGTHITGSTTGANGFDATQSGNPSLFLYNNTSQNWNSIPNTASTTLTAGSAYRLMVRGDRSIDMNTNTPNPTPTVLRSRGTLQIGNYTATSLNTLADTFNLIGNPYQSAVDIKAVLLNSTNVNPNFYYVWDPKIGGTNGRGGYVTYSFLTNTNNVNGSAVDAYLQPMQACFVKTLSNGAASVNFQESNKYLPTNENIYRTSNSTLPILHLNLFNAIVTSPDETALDGIMLLFGNQFSNELDANDAGKLMNLDENFSVLVSNSKCSIASFDMPNLYTVYPLNLSNYRGQNYVFKAKLENYHGLTPYLYDQYLGTYTQLENNTTYSFNIDSNQIASTDASRFKLVFQSNITVNNNLENLVNIYPNPSNTGSFVCSFDSQLKNVKIEVFNQLGQKIELNQTKTITNQIECMLTNSIQRGIYHVKISSDTGATIVKKWIVN
ncbi:T9SS type A sorting domain-containing protein [Flavobacterium sp. 20NA77.7]|uniref:T9SS type A sorting domain-containing protein n=1 Tax=Flavobacterium nakdongensis TaxID=3073563 RepID=A0ABY9RBK2_9FLAO|nr:T9SS type A sorting domain-containing protein [Flavobacterium sp. 20NA77.7]WMW78618.1 T9SS type A sorting domain-containing protein [Flavobacterium sp. 20NA77.7]